MTRKLMRFILPIITVIALLTCMQGMSSTKAAAAPDVSFVKVNGNKVSFPDGQPIIKDSRTLVPIRFISEALGYDVNWDATTRTAVIGENKILLPIGSNTATVNGISVSVNVPAQLIGTGMEARTYVPLRFISENLGCTVDWFSANRSIIINALLPDGKELDLYNRCKQSELFYEVFWPNKYGALDPEWDSKLYYKASLSELTNDACTDANWFIARRFHRYPSGNQRENGEDIYINLVTPTLQSRHEIKALLQTFYPTGYNDVYDILMKTIREEIFESYGTVTPSISGTFGIHYIDSREVAMWRNTGALSTSIYIKDMGYVNPEKGQIWPADVIEREIKNGVSRQEGGKWFMETFELDTW
jgi:hypothetical protein